jgi:hypothetical protein
MMRIMGHIFPSDFHLSFHETDPAKRPKEGFFRQSNMGVTDKRTARIRPGMTPAIKSRPTDALVKIAKIIMTALGGINGPKIPPVKSAPKAKDFL